jgi:phosphatidylinositol glycan class T
LVFFSHCTFEGELTEIALDGKNDYHILISADGSSTIYLNYNIPPQSSLFTHIDFEPTYLPFEQFPADPNRGFDIPPSIASFSMPSSDTTLLYTNALLVMPPVPDMSMPFNVISLSSTCFAIIIATSINLIIKKSSQSISDKLNGVKRKSPMDKVKEKIQRIKAKFS